MPGDESTDRSVGVRAVDEPDAAVQDRRGRHTQPLNSLGDPPRAGAFRCEVGRARDGLGYRRDSRSTVGEVRDLDAETVESFDEAPRAVERVDRPVGEGTRPRNAGSIEALLGKHELARELAFEHAEHPALGREVGARLKLTASGFGAYDAAAQLHQRGTSRTHGCEREREARMPR